VVVVYKAGIAPKHRVAQGRFRAFVWSSDPEPRQMLVFWLSLSFLGIIAEDAAKMLADCTINPRCGRAFKLLVNLNRGLNRVSFFIFKGPSHNQITKCLLQETKTTIKDRKSTRLNSSHVKTS